MVLVTVVIYYEHYFYIKTEGKYSINHDAIKIFNQLGPWQ